MSNAAKSLRDAGARLLAIADQLREQAANHVAVALDLNSRATEMFHEADQLDAEERQKGRGK